MIQKNKNIVVYNSIQAWFWTAADEVSRHSMDIAHYVIEKPNTSIVATVKWESMIEAGIYPGDLVVVDKGAKVQFWDVVIAKIDHEYTLKYYERDSAGRIFLRPANNSMSNIYPQEELEIFWVVKSLVRKY